MPTKANCRYQLYNVYKLTHEHDLVLCDHIIGEMRQVVARKQPDLLADVEVLLAQLAYELVSAPTTPGKLMAGPNDQPF